MEVLYFCAVMEYEIFKKFTSIFALTTERDGGVSQGNFSSLNLCDYSGDEPDFVEKNRVIFCQKNGIKRERFFMPKQVHGTEFLRIDENFLALETAQQTALLDGVDALITDVEGVCIGVSTADCVPILLFCSQKRVVAAVHSGWRGTLNRVVERVLAEMVGGYGCRASEILAVIAPCISVKNYEVGDEIVEKFNSFGFPINNIFKNFNKFHLDLKKANQWILEQNGVKTENIQVAENCTFDESERFFSARKLGIKSGRIASCIMLKPRPTLIIDEDIPFIKGVFEKEANVKFLPAKAMTNDAIRGADGLIIRTRTRCDEKLLRGSNVKFIHTATIGFDHIDVNFCNKFNIFWENSPGCNASSVAQYVGAALCFWEEKRGSLVGKTIGIVGVGHVGSEVEKMAKQLGMNVLRNDPPREKRGEKGFVSLDEIAEKSDVITFHTPLVFDGEFPTYYLGCENFFLKLKRNPLIINTSRGGIIDEKALFKSFESGAVSDFVLDCWENEPKIDRVLLEKALLATPHIAGYSADGKANATKMSVRSASRFFGLELDDFLPNLEPKPRYPIAEVRRALLETYPIFRDSEKLKNSPETFENQRNNYPIRREFELF